MEQIFGQTSNIYTIVIICFRSYSVWGILIFTLNDNREYLHKAEIENIKAQIGNKQSEIHILILNLELLLGFMT